MKIAIPIVCGLLMLACVAWGQTPAKAMPDPMKKSAGFDPKRDAAKDIRDGIAKAKKEHKRVLIDVGGEW